MNTTHQKPVIYIMTRKWLSVTAIACLGLFGIGTTTQGAVLVSYDFDNTSDLTEIGQDNVVGTPTLTLVKDGGDNIVDAAFGTANAAPDWAAAWDTTASGGSYWQIDLDTTSYEDLILDFYNRSSGAGATSVTVSWATNNSGLFTNVQTVGLNRVSSFSHYQVDLSAISQIENTASVQIRATWGTDGTGPNTRLDDVSLSGTLVPEPGSLALLGLAGSLMIWRKRHG